MPKVNNIMFLLATVIASWENKISIQLFAVTDINLTIITANMF